MKTFNVPCVIIAFLICACTTQTPIPEVQVQIVKVPVPCDVELPTKPKDRRNLESAKQIAGYYKQVEMLLLDCQKLGDTDLKAD